MYRTAGEKLIGRALEKGVAAYLSVRAPMNQPFDFRPNAEHSKPRGRWCGGAHRRYGDGRSAYPRDRNGKADGLIALLYSEPRRTELKRKHNVWFADGDYCTYHQGALISGTALNEKERLDRKAKLQMIRDELENLRG